MLPNGLGTRFFASLFLPAVSVTLLMGAIQATLSVTGAFLSRCCYCQRDAAIGEGRYVVLIAAFRQASDA